MIVHDFPQYSPEWWAARRGIPTASQAKKVFTSQGKASASQQDFIRELIDQFYNSSYGIEEDTATAAMKNGHLREADARQAYMKHTGCVVREVGFCLDDQRRWGASPDGLGESHGLEIKCPTGKTFVGYRQAKDKVPADYIPQVHWSMVVTGLKEWHFFSWHPDYENPVFVPVQWDDYTEAMAEAMEKFDAKYKKEKTNFLSENPIREQADNLEAAHEYVEAY